MIIQGTLVQIKPQHFQDTHGNFYQWVTVQTHQGPVEGMKGSKVELTQQNLGQAIEWEMEQKQGQKGPWNKFKKPQEQQQGGYQQPQQQPQQGYQQPQQQIPQQQPRPQQSQPLPGPDATGRMIIAQVAAKIVAEIMVGTDLRFNNVGEMEHAINDWFTAIIKVGSGNVAPRQQQNYGGNQVPNEYEDQQSQIPDY